MADEYPLYQVVDEDADEEIGYFPLDRAARLYGFYPPFRGVVGAIDGPSGELRSLTPAEKNRISIIGLSDT